MEFGSSVRLGDIDEIQPITCANKDASTTVLAYPDEEGRTDLNFHCDHVDNITCTKTGNECPALQLPGTIHNELVRVFILKPVVQRSTDIHDDAYKGAGDHAWTEES